MGKMAGAVLNIKRAAKFKALGLRPIIGLAEDTLVGDGVLIRGIGNWSIAIFTS